MLPARSLHPLQFPNLIRPCSYLLRPFHPRRFTPPSPPAISSKLQSFWPNLPLLPQPPVHSQSLAVRRAPMVARYDIRRGPVQARMRRLRLEESSSERDQNGPLTPHCACFPKPMPPCRAFLLVTSPPTSRQNRRDCSRRAVTSQTMVEL
ncbi:uncharacterized protein B0H18DRAFT_107870 [Fomitopsis serialis]|uniref:uncharacterized protein n=1 Tax=Fomitopsis serialis TaxID=139415 RepID=UPI00200751DE|nr:uncharacterized protein B0H18DRAFT_107870 [Neoantrodia serialis]KAH9915099.1 hypothetical protein B0H18DRAFT_107870 [Neoantrodia serialis]